MSKRVINIGEDDFIRVENKPKAGCPEYPILKSLIDLYKAALGLGHKKGLDKSTPSPDKSTSSAGKGSLSPGESPSSPGKGVKGPDPPSSVKKHHCPSYAEVIRKMIALRDRLSHHGKGPKKFKERPLEPDPPRIKPVPAPKLRKKTDPIYKVPEPRRPDIIAPKPRRPDRDDEHEK